MIRVLLVEDDEVFRLGMKVSLTHAPEIELVASCGDGDTAIMLAIEHRPDVILMDIGLPGMDGLEATRRIKAALKDQSSRILVLTSHQEPKLVDAMLAAGADGYCLKGIKTDRLLTLIQDIHEGVFWIDAAVAQHLRDSMQPTSSRMNNESDSAIPNYLPPEILSTLTAREQEILFLIAEGRKNNDIANLLCISPGTVRVHVHSVLNKLNVKDRTQAALFVVKKPNNDIFKA